MKAILTLEDGSVFEGISIGVPGTTFGEVVFSTSMTGYQEMLTDPSYGGQLLALTYPLVGNYGITETDSESEKPQVAGFIVRQMCAEPSNWRSTESLQSFLTRQSVVGIEGIDTRKLAKHIRTNGVMMGAISTEHSSSELKERIQEQQSYSKADLAKLVSCNRAGEWMGESDAPEPHGTIAVLDCGVRRSILQDIRSLGYRINLFPCGTKSEEILAAEPCGIVISPGPGNPENLGYVAQEVKKLIGKKPMLGVGLGHQLLSMALGGRTVKLKFGHRGSNHPVKDTASGKVHITNQNHGYAVDPESLAGTGAEIKMVSLNDGSVEGLQIKDLKVFSIQYYPEGKPEEKDRAQLFVDFVKSLESC